MIGAVALAALAGCSGKADNYGCPTIDAQGGDVEGTWNLSKDTCAVPYDRVQSGDWCSQLVYDANGVRVAMLGHDTLVPQISGSTITLTADKKYKSQITWQGPSESSFPEACLRAYGQAPTCSDLTAALSSFFDPKKGVSAAFQSYRLSTTVPTYPSCSVDHTLNLIPKPSYSNFDCKDNGNGCDCTYTVGLVIADCGAWMSDGSILTLNSETEAPPYVNDFSASGTELIVTGHDGLDIMGQQGLHTLVFAKQ